MDNFRVDIDENFWECNPQFKYHSAFKDLYDKDKSKNKEKSSQILWATMLYSDSTRSQFYLLSATEREEEIKTNYLDDPAWWTEVPNYIEPYKKFVMTALERQYQAQQDKLMERTQFIMTTRYDVETAPILDKLQIDTPKLQTTLRDMETQIKGDQPGGVWKGGDKKTIAEQKKL